MTTGPGQEPRLRQVHAATGNEETYGQARQPMVVGPSRRLSRRGKTDTRVTRLTPPYASLSAISARCIPNSTGEDHADTEANHIGSCR